MNNKDIEILESLSNQYDVHSLVNAVYETGEYMIGMHGKGSAEQTTGTKDRGVKGALKALPSALLYGFISPPGALIAAIGALSKRADRSWAESLLNPNNWLDYLSTRYKDKPAPPKEETPKDSSSAVDEIPSAVDDVDSSTNSNVAAADLTKEEIRKNSQYFYAKLSNDEIYRVSALDELEAKKKIDTIIAFIPYEALRARHDAKMHTYRITYNDLEERYWIADSPERAKAELKAVYEQLAEADKNAGVPASMVNKNIPQPVQVEDIGIIPLEKPSDTFEVTKTIPLSTKQKKKRNIKSRENYYESAMTDTYKAKIGRMEFNIPGDDNPETVEKLKKFIETIYRSIIEFNRMRYADTSKTHHAYVVQMSDMDKYILIATTEADARINAVAIERMKYKRLRDLKINSIIHCLDEIGSLLPKPLKSAELDLKKFDIDTILEEPSEKINLIKIAA